MAPRHIFKFSTPVENLVEKPKKMASTTIWDQVLGRLEAQVGHHSFSTWFKPTSLLADDGRLCR